MKWSLAWLVVLSALSGGCQSATNRYDPFSMYGPRVVPPPATGTLGQAPGAYYQAPAAAPQGAAQPPLLPVPSLGSQPRATHTGVVGSSNHWVPTDPPLAQAPEPPSDTGQVVRTGGALRPSESLPWRTPDSARGHVQPAAAYDSAPYGPPRPLPFDPSDVTEITELPRPIRPQLPGIPSAAVFPALPVGPTIEPVIYDQPVYDQPIYDYGHVVSTSVRTDAWRQRR